MAQNTNHPNRNRKQPIDWERILVDAVFGKLIDSLVEEGFRVEVSDQDGNGLYVYAAADGGEKPEDGYHYWVKLVPANSAATFISDYTNNLEHVIKPALDFAAAFDVND